MVAATVGPPPVTYWMYAELVLGKLAVLSPRYAATIELVAWVSAPALVVQVAVPEVTVAPAQRLPAAPPLAVKFMVPAGAGELPPFETTAVQVVEPPELDGLGEQLTVVVVLYSTFCE